LDYFACFLIAFLFPLGPLALTDDQKPEHSTSTIGKIVGKEGVVNEHETEKYYE
jgi:hypothetical protein